MIVSFTVEMNITGSDVWQIEAEYFSKINKINISTFQLIFILY